MAVPNYVKALKASSMTVSGVTASELEGELITVADETDGAKYSVIDPSLKKAVQNF